MSVPRTSTLQKLVRFGAIAALATAIVIWPVYAGVASSAVTYQQIVPVDDALVDVNRFTYSEDPTGDVADVVAIYGSPKGDPTSYVFVDESRVLHPEEQPELALLKAPAEGQPLQLALVRFFAVRLSLGALVASLSLFGLGLFLRRRATAAGHLEPATT